MAYQRFAHIEGLRGYLALWVAIGHGLQLAGYFQVPTAFSVFLRGGDAVAVFMIISGFVITHLLFEKKEHYTSYIVRRFFRLYPIYAFTSVIGYFVAGLWLHVAQVAPWQGDPAWKAYTNFLGALYDGSRANFWENFYLHVTMLHGLVPNEVVAFAPMIFLPAAWSISLEWQFYLIAPLVIKSIFERKKLLLLCGLVTWLFLLFSHGILGTYSVASTLAGAAGYFAVGIASRYALSAASQYSPISLAAVGLFVSIVFFRDPLPISIWVAFYSFLAGQRNDTWGYKIFDLAFTSDRVKHMGQISYSTYLIHRPMQVIFASVAISLIPEIPKMLALAVQLLAIPASLFAANYLYRWIEVPGIAFGRSVATWLSPVAHR